MLYVPPIRGEYHPFYIQLSGSNSAVDVKSTYSVIIKTHDYPSFRKPKEPYKNDWKDEGVRRTCVSIRKYQNILGYTEQWMTEYVHTIVMLAKKEPKKNSEQ